MRACNVSLVRVDRLVIVAVREVDICVPVVVVVVPEDDDDIVDTCAPDVVVDAVMC